jgi:deazaflavin-dependent oxidoreductase (nitroreductase family)
MADMNDFNAKLIAEFRENDGKVTGDFGKVPLVLITHRGAKSGIERTSPLVYSLDGDRVIIIASKGGAAAHPHWYLNMVANPEVTVELPGDTYRAKVTEVTGAERDRLYAAQAATMPQFDQYAINAGDRIIPVLALERITSN